MKKKLGRNTENSIQVLKRMMNQEWEALSSNIAVCSRAPQDLMLIIHFSDGFVHLVLPDNISVRERMYEELRKRVNPMNDQMILEASRSTFQSCRPENPVFCDQCVFCSKSLNDQSVEISCTCPENMGDWFSSDHRRAPQEINRNNDCEWFQSKFHDNEVRTNDNEAEIKKICLLKDSKVSS